MKKLVSMCLVLLIAITASMSTLAITGCNKAPEKETGAITNGSFEISEFRGNGISLMSVTPMTVAENSTYAEQTLKATVMPENATNKEVDWSVAWADGQEGTVTDYVTVTATVNDSTTASVKCYQAFTGNIVITVTTRENKYVANCIVTFVGVPTDINVTGTIVESSDGFYYLGVGGDYSYEVNLNNIFGIVSDDYKNVEVAMGMYGSIEVGSYEVYKSGGDNWFGVKTIFLETIQDKLMTVSYDNGILTITTIRTIESYYSSTQTLDGGRTTVYNNRFKDYASDEAYFFIVIKENNSGLQKIMKIKYDENVVTGVNVSSSQINF